MLHLRDNLPQRIPIKTSFRWSWKTPESSLIGFVSRHAYLSAGILISFSLILSQIARVKRLNVSPCLPRRLNAHGPVRSCSPFLAFNERLCRFRRNLQRDFEEQTRRASRQTVELLIHLKQQRLTQPLEVALDVLGNCDGSARTRLN